LNLNTAVGEWQIRQAAEREDVARKAVGFRYRSLTVTARQHPDFYR
jgi:hypothetical protein